MLSRSALALFALTAGVALADDSADPGVAFDAALDLLEAGQVRQGCEALQGVHRAFPGSQQSAQALKVATAIGRLAPSTCRWAIVGGAEATQSGSTELILSQAVVAPVWFATAPSVWGRPGTSVTPAVLLSFAGLGVGIGGTYAATRRWEPSTGQAMSIYTGELLGGWYGLWIAGLADADSGTQIARSAHAGVIAGGLAGLAYGAIGKPRAGDMAMLRSGAIWGTAYGGYVAIATEPGGRGTFLSLGLGTTAGLLGGAALNSVVELRRGQVNTVNLGGYAGTVVGMGVAALIGQGTDLGPVGGSVIVATGTTAGLLTGALLVDHEIRVSRRSQLAASPPMPGILPDGNGGRVPGVTVAGSF